MAEGSEVISLFPTAIQAYATVVASVILGTMTVFTYFRKMKSDLINTHKEVSSLNATEIQGWFQKLIDVTNSSNTKIQLIVDALEKHEHQAEMDRAYNKGRDDSLDNATKAVARKLQNSQ